MKLRIFTLLILFLFTKATFGEENNPLSLQDYWALAEKHTPGLRARLKQIESIEHSLNSLPKWYRPNINTELGYGTSFNKDKAVHGPVARIVAEWIVWDGGRTEYAKLYGAKQANSQRWHQAVLKINLKVTIAGQYYQAVLLKELKEIINSQIDELQKLSNLVKPRIRIGRSGKSDLEDIALRIERLKSDRQTIGQAEKLLLQQLNLLIGKEKDSTITLPLIRKASPLSNIKQAIGLEFTSMPKYRLMHSKIQSLEAKLKSTERQLYWPSLGLETYGGYGPHIDTIDPLKPEVGVGLRMSFPLYSSVDCSALLKSKEAEINAAKLDLEQELIRSKISFNKKISGTLVNRNRVEKLSDFIVRGERNLKLSLRDFARGLKSATDIYAVIESLSDSRREHVTLRAHWLTQDAEIYLLKQLNAKRNNTNKKRH